MAAPDHHDSAHDTDPAQKPGLFGWNRAEFQTLLLALALLGLWVVSTALFGFAGLITVGLIFVLSAFVALVFISRG